MRSNRRILVTGGAGYVGSHTCKSLARAGFEPIAYDNLVNGHERLVKWGPLEKGDIRDRARLDAVFARYRPSVVIHLAARTEVAFSIADPATFYDVNVAGSLGVIAAARAAGAGKVVFSSSCAAYGSCRSVPMAEDHPTEPINPYGRSKLMIERVLRDLSAAGQMTHVALRYFNVAGADPEGECGERHDPETHVVPLLMRKILAQTGEFTVFGTDYSTRDGTAERDYIHVSDIAEANVLALQWLLDGAGSETFNLGAGTGTTVREIIDGAEQITDCAVRVTEAGRRPGDPAQLIADISKAGALLGHANRMSDRQTILETAYRWHKEHEPALFGPAGEALTSAMALRAENAKPC